MEKRKNEKERKKKKTGWEVDKKVGSDGEREIVVNRVSDTRRNTLDITRWSGWMTMFSEFLSAKQVNSGFANSVTTDGNDSARPVNIHDRKDGRRDGHRIHVHIKPAIRATTTARSFRKRAEAE